MSRGATVWLIAGNVLQVFLLLLGDPTLLVGRREFEILFSAPYQFGFLLVFELQSVLSPAFPLELLVISYVCN